MFLHWRVGFWWELPEHLLVVVNHSLHVGLGAVAISSVRIAEEITSKVVRRLFNILQLVVVGVRLQRSVEGVRVPQRSKHIVDINNHILIAIACIT